MDLSRLCESVPIFDGVHVMKQVKQTGKLWITVFLTVLFNHGTQSGETKFDFSGAYFLNVNVNVTNITYAPTSSEVFLPGKPMQY